MCSTLYCTILIVHMTQQSSPGSSRSFFSLPQVSFSINVRLSGSASSHPPRSQTPHGSVPHEQAPSFWHPHNFSGADGKAYSGVHAQALNVRADARVARGGKEGRLWLEMGTVLTTTLNCQRRPAQSHSLAPLGLKESQQILIVSKGRALADSHILAVVSNQCAHLAQFSIEHQQSTNALPLLSAVATSTVPTRPPPGR